MFCLACLCFFVLNDVLVLLLMWFVMLVVWFVVLVSMYIYTVCLLHCCVVVCVAVVGFVVQMCCFRVLIACVVPFWLLCVSFGAVFLGEVPRLPEL